MPDEPVDADLFDEFLTEAQLRHISRTSARWEHPDWHPSPGERAAADQAEAAALAALRATRSGAPEIRSDRGDLHLPLGALDSDAEGVHLTVVVSDRYRYLDGLRRVDPLNADGPHDGDGAASSGTDAET